MNTLVAVINHNRRAYTDQLVESLTIKGAEYDIMVLDNGSTDKSEISKYTTHATDSNCYYGGALNLICANFLETDKHDMLLVLNNDIILHGPKFVFSMRLAMDLFKYHVLSPCILQPEVNQCYWRTMHNWGAVVRPVKWVDFCAPMIRREVVEKIKQYDNELIYGWGQDLYTGMVCEENNWKVGVVDCVPAIHLSSATFKEGKSDITETEYGQKAMAGMVSYFNRIGKGDKLNEYRDYARNYTYSD